VSKSKPVILFATPVLHHPPIGGPTLRIENSIKALARISDLHVYSRAKIDQIGGVRARDFYQQCCHNFYFAPLADNSNRYISFIRRGIDYLARRIVGSNILEIENFGYLLKTANRIKADIIWLGYGNISYPLLRYIKTHSNYKVVVDTDSVWSRFVLRGLPYAKSEKKRRKIERSGHAKEEEERWGTPLTHVTTAVSEVDALYYRGLVDTPGKIHLFSNVIDLDVYKKMPLAPIDFKKPCIYLAGTFWFNSPMEDAARWTIDEVLPYLRQKIPNLHFYIVGNDSDRVLKDIQSPNITITGQLESVLPYLRHASMALVPLRFESGTRFKILEAGACGIPVVSTTLGAEGIAVTDGQDILIADEPKQFADAIFKIIDNPAFAESLGSNLKKLVSDRYSIETLAQEGQQILDYVTSLDSIN